MRRTIILVVLAFGALAFAAVGAAHPKGEHAKQHAKAPGHHKDAAPGHKGGDTYGPYSVTTTDNGCSGSPWANDSLKRTYVVKRTKGAPGSTTSTWRLWRYDRGTFITMTGVSPGNCAANTTPHGTAITQGKLGKVHGVLMGVVTGGTYNPSAACTDSTCGSTSGFITTHFGSGAHYSCFETSTQCKFAFEYSAPAQQLTYHHWTDRGTGAGSSLNETFKGDIAN
jgi:hypothetical protein